MTDRETIAKSAGWEYAEKRKIRAVRFFLAQTSDELKTLRTKFLTLRSFRTVRAAEVFKNPFLNGNGHLYVLSRIAHWADVTLPKNWYLMATPEYAIELQKAILKQPFKHVGEGDIEPVMYDAYLGEAKAKFLVELAAKNELGGSSDGREGKRARRSSCDNK